MKQSKLYVKTSKNPPKDEVSVNARLLMQAGFVDKLMAGAYTLLPLGLRVYWKIENIIREEMDHIGGAELVMPSLHPKENWTATGRWDSMDDLFKLPLGQDKELALGPTHEEVIVPIAKKFIASYQDLPAYLYQFQNKFRNELRAKSGIMRLKEFVMKDLYSFHASQEDLDAYYEQVKSAYTAIFKRCGIGDQTYLTYASGGTFSKYSHEFQALTAAGEDTIHICAKCRIAVNKEIITDQARACPECGNQELTEEKAVEVGNIFKLGNRFSAPFGMRYRDSEGAERDVIMGCYGIGLQRLMGTIAELSHDGQGLVWPESVAPFRVHLIVLAGRDGSVAERAEELYETLGKNGVETLYDDRAGYSAGERFADADLIGCPWRVIVSEKTLEGGKCELKPRSGGDTRLLSFGEAASMLSAKI